jgi:hypothetical protein
MPKSWFRKLYNTNVYWALSFDDIRNEIVFCRKCREWPRKELILTQILNGHRTILCLKCVDANWLSTARCLGKVKYRDRLDSHSFWTRSESASY